MTGETADDAVSDRDDTPGAGDPAPAVSGGGRPVRWRRLCGEPVTVERGSYPCTSDAARAATGKREGPDGHLAIAADAPPEMTAVAQAVMADFPAYRVDVCYGLFYRAVRRNSVAPVPVGADDEDELRHRLAAHARMLRRAGTR